MRRMGENYRKEKITAEKTTVENITEENYVQEAKWVIEHIKNYSGKPALTTSKIRSILAKLSDIYNQIINNTDEKLSEEINSQIEYLKVRIVYECGREKLVKEFEEKADLLKNLEKIKGSRKNFILFYRYMEALVAYHRFQGGKDL